MRVYPGWLHFAVLAISVVICQPARAASLNGKVIEINDGDELTIFNLNRPVRVKLLGVDAPEKDQPFGAAARQHLSDLVFNKNVLVEYSGIGQHNSLIGRVLLNDSDIGAQMIRDGAAWFDPSYKSQLADTQREIYYQSELAARSEKRGLWQSGDAVAPWEFVKGQSLKQNPVASPPTVRATHGPINNRQTSELTSLSLLRTGTSVPKPQPGSYIETSDMSWADGPFRKTWKRFHPPGEHFSALLPDDGEQATKSVPFRLANSFPVVERTFDVSYYRTRDGYTAFELVWFTVPSLGETDSIAIQSGLNSIIRGVGAGVEANGINFQCEPTSQIDISSGGFAGAQFDLSGCTLPGMARVYTKVIGDQRKYYIGFTFYKQDDDNVMKFVKSFTVIGNTSEKLKRKETR